ncbi:MAG: hypothetical protein Q9162_007120 [Coniocarpon cinnabarinum]
MGLFTGFIFLMILLFVSGGDAAIDDIINAAAVVVFGCIFLGSSSAFNAITAASVVALGVSYGIPIAVNVAQMRRALPPRAFELPPAVGWACNLLGLSFIILTTVLFVFPPELPVSGSNMNYCIAAFGIILIISTTQWIVDGRQNYSGPKVDEQILQAAASHDAGVDPTVIKPGADETSQQQATKHL